MLARQPPNSQLKDPWRSFLAELDRRLGAEAHLHCIGGFVVSQHYGLARPTVDLDFINVVPYPEQAELLSLAGRGSELHRKYDLYLDAVGVTDYPDDYETRLIEFEADWTKLHIWVLEAHDLALSKLQRNSQKDLTDVIYLASRGLITADTLVQRYRAEMRPYLSNEARHDLTLKLWIEACWPPS